VTAAYREAFSGLPRPVWLLSLATLVNRSGTMVLPFLALFLTLKRGYSPADAGQLLALYGLGGMGASFLGGWLAGRFSPAAVMKASLLLNGVGFLVLGRLHERWAIAAVVLGASLAGEAFRPAAFAALTLASDAGARSRSFSLHRLAVNLGMTLGPAAGGFLALYDYGWLFVADGLTCLAAGALLTTLRLERPKAMPANLARPSAGARASGDGAAAAAAPSPDRSPWRDGRFLAMLVLVFSLAVVVFQTQSTYPLTLHGELGFSEAWIGLLFAVNTLIIVVFEMVLIHSLQGRDPLRWVGFGSFLFCAGFALLAFGSSRAWVAFTVVVWTAGEMISFPLASSAVAERAGRRHLGSYMGLYNFAFSSAFVAAPLAGTWVLQHFGSRVLWLGCGAVGVATWLGFTALSAFARRFDSEQPVAAPAVPA
jgi:predicted MFS family arabinose efflux permease